MVVHISVCNVFSTFFMSYSYPYTYIQELQTEKNAEGSTKLESFDKKNKIQSSRTHVVTLSRDETSFCLFAWIFCAYL